MCPCEYLVSTDLPFVPCDNGAADEMDYAEQSYSVPPEEEDTDTDHGEGPSKPYGAQTSDTPDEDSNEGEYMRSDLCTLCLYPCFA